MKSFMAFTQMLNGARILPDLLVSALSISKPLMARPAAGETTLGLSPFVRKFIDVTFNHKLKFYLQSTCASKKRQLVHVLTDLFQDLSCVHTCLVYM